MFDMAVPPYLLHLLDPVIDPVSGRRFSISMSPVSPPLSLAGCADRRRSSIVSAV